MKQCISPKPFSEILAEPADLSPHWSPFSLKSGQPVAQPAVRRNGPATVSTAAAQVLIELTEGQIHVRYVGDPDPALAANFLTGEERVDRMLYRTRSKQFYSTTKIAQPTQEAALAATFLLLHRVPDFSQAYLALLKAMASLAWQPHKLSRLLASAADELVYACAVDLRLDDQPCDTVWFYNIIPDIDRIDVFDDPSRLWLDELLREPDFLKAYLAGKPAYISDLKIGPLA